MNIDDPGDSRPIGEGGSMKSLRTTVSLLIVLGALTLPTSALAGGFTAVLHDSTHTPKVGAQQITVTATRGRQKLSGSVHYRFLLGKTVVSTKPGHKFTRGFFRDKLLWPAEAVGHRITLQVVVQTKFGTDYLNWWVKVR
jgi:hypothetical protein